MNLDKRLLLYLKTNRFLLFSSIFSGISAAFCTIGQAWLLAHIISQVFLEKQTFIQLQGFLLAFALLSLMRFGLHWVSQERSQVLASKIKLEVRSALNQHLNGLGPIYSASQKSGELSNTIHNGVEQLNAYFSQYVPQLFYSALIPITVLFFVFPKDLLSGIVLLLTAPIIPVFMILIGYSAQALTNKQWQALSKMSAHYLDVLQGLTTLKIFGQSKQKSTTIFKMSDCFRQLTMNVLRVAFLSALVLEMASTISTAVIAVEIGLRLMSAKMAFEPALFILILTPEFYQPMRQLGARFHSGMEGISSAQRIFEILNISNPGLKSGMKEGLHLLSGEIRFEQVSYTYPQGAYPALNNISFTLQPGTKTVLIGKSGSGKTSVGNLLLCFAVPQSGNIYLGNTKINGICKEDWRKQISWLPQSPYLFHESIAQNILLARPQATQEELVEACKQANLLDFIKSLPQQFDTIVGEQGARLSGGQVQRVALARAFLKQASFLILDEPTSNMDPLLDNEIQQNIQKLSAGKTVLTIAHRLSTIQKADQVILLEQGRILESGTHQTLMQKKGKYFTLIHDYRGACS